MKCFVELQRACAFIHKETKSLEKSPRHYNRQLQFLYGYLLGFLMALITLLCYDRFLLQTPLQQQHSTITENWRAGYTSALEKLQSDSNSIQDRLIKEVRVLCMVLTTPMQHKTRAAHVKATWGKRCTRLIFLSSENDDELGAVSVVDQASDTYDLLWHKLRQGLRYVYARYYKEYDWFLKADDDTYVIMENLRYSLYAYQSASPLFFGYELSQQNKTYMSGGAGYVLSREALHRVVNLGFNNSTLCPPANYALPEDYSISLCLQNVGVLRLDGRFMLPNERKPKMFPLQLLDFMKANETLAVADWIDRLTPYSVEWGTNCCSNYSISFHYAHPAEMYMYEFFVYHLRTAGFHHPTTVLPKKIDFTEFSKRFSYNNKAIVSWMPLEWASVS